MSSSRRTCLTCSSEVPALLKWPAPKQALTMGMGLHIVEALWCCFCEKNYHALSDLVVLCSSIHIHVQERPCRYNYMCNSDPVATCATATQRPCR